MEDELEKRECDESAEMTAEDAALAGAALAGELDALQDEVDEAPVLEGLEVTAEATDDSELEAGADAAEPEEDAGEPAEDAGEPAAEGTGEPAPAPDLTVIIPVHDAEPYLAGCLDSVLAMGEDDDDAVAAPPSLEIICIDDASRDASASILADFAAAHPEIRVETQPSCQGVSAARNRGLELARGRYVGFVDADDWVDRRLGTHAVTAAKRRDAQMLIYGFYESWSDGRTAPREMCEDPAFQGHTFSLDDFPRPATELVTPNVWRILFSREFLEQTGLRFHEELKTAEDLAFIYEALFAADRIALLPERLYHYRQDAENSLTHRPRNGSGFSALTRMRETVELNGWKRSSYNRHAVNLVLDVADYSLRSASDLGEFRSLFETLRDGWLQRCLFYRHLVDGRYLPFLGVAEAAGDPIDLLFFFYREERGACDRLRADVEGQRRRAEDAEARDAFLERRVGDERERADHAEWQAREIYASRSFRLGNLVMAPLAKIRQAILGEK